MIIRTRLAAGACALLALLAAGVAFPAGAAADEVSAMAPKVCTSPRSRCAAAPT
jgi:Ca-activated chloride channel family protein